MKKHKKSEQHILNNKRKNIEIGDEEIQCKVCGEKVLRKHMKNHKSTIKHVDAQKEKDQNALSLEKSRDNSEIECKLCKEKILRKDMKEHKKSERHILNKERKIRERGEEEIQCKVCGQKFLRKNLNEHETSVKHVEAQREIRGESECDVCKEKYIKGLWKEHAKTEIHMMVYQQKQELKEAARSRRSHGKEIYKMRLGSGENQHYINTLTTFLAVRCAFNTDEDFVISVNNDRWNEFGDIVIEMIDSEGPKIIEAIRCKKVETKSNYTTLALSEESGNLSLKEQCDNMRKICEKNSDQTLVRIKNLLQKKIAGELTEEDSQALQNSNENFVKVKNLAERELTGVLTEDDKRDLDNMKLNGYQNANFRLLTVSNVVVDHNPRYNYTDEILGNWKSKDKLLWKNSDVEITHPNNKKKDLFNTTDDTDDVCTFQVFNHRVEGLNSDLKKFHFYINQKRRTDLQAQITTMIEDEVGVALDISDDLIKYMRKTFKADKPRKPNERTFKVTKEDLLLKICELLLAPFWVLPQGVLNERNNLDAWNKTIQEFDVTVMDYDDDVVDKIYGGLKCILKEKTKYTSEVKVDISKVEDGILKTHLFGYDQSLKFLYFALWKSGLAPLVLKIDNENHLKLICSVVTFLKSKQFHLKIIVTTADFKPTINCMPRKLRVFFNLKDLKTHLSKKCLNTVLDLKFKILDSETSLREIESWNKGFLERLTPDALLNIYLGDFLFMDVVLPMTKDIIEDTLVFNDEDISNIRQYFQNRDGIEPEGSSERQLTYLVNVEDVPSYVKVPPEL